jgi:hypothetical protein
MSGEPSVRAGGEAAAYFAVEVFAFGGLHGDVAGEGVEPVSRRREVSGGLEFGGGGQESPSPSPIAS